MGGKLRVLVVATLACGTLAPSVRPVAAVSAAAQDEPRRLTLERLYSLPSLIGTAPRGSSWSADSERLAFLWNDRGESFRDVWVVDIGDAELTPMRATMMPKPTADAESDDPFEIARAAERVERDGGAASAIWRPGGRHLLVSFRGDLWRVVLGQQPVPITETPQPESGAAYSSDGRRLAFMRGGDVWTLPAGSGVSVAATRVTSLAADGIRVGSFLWPPDGSQLAVEEVDSRAVPERGIPDYLGDEPVMVRLRRAYPGDPAPRRRIGLVDVSRGASASIEWLELADPAPDLLLSYTWSPHGASLAIDTSDLYAKDRRVYVADATSQAPAVRIVARDRDDENETFYFWRIAWASDSSRLYFLSDREEDYHVWSVDPARPTAAPRRLTGGDWAVVEMRPVDSGLVVVGNHGRAEERHLFRVGDSASVGELTQLSQRTGSHAPVISPDGHWAAVAHSSDDSPPDLLLTSLVGERTEDTERTVTHSPLPEFGRYRWVTPSYVSFRSHVDGSTLHARLTLPPDFDANRRYSAILGSVYTDSVRNQWGGRTAHPTWGLDQYLAQQGYVLLNVDMRGSWGAAASIVAASGSTMAVSISRTSRAACVSCRRLDTST